MPSVAEDGELASQAIAQTHRALPECPLPLPRDSSSRAATTYSRISRSASPMPAAQLSHRRFRPTCTHLTTTRLYTDSLLCDICHQPPPWGWLYRCIQDRELELLDQIFEGEMLDEIFESEPIEVRQSCRHLLPPSKLIKCARIISTTLERCFAKRSSFLPVDDTLA